MIENNKIDNIGVVIVCYNTPNIISNAVKSVYPHVHQVCIIDNSDKNNHCFSECDELSQKINNVFVHHTNANIGHGPGLNIGIEKLNTMYIICMDSDAFLIDLSIINEMKNELKPDVYGCGRVLNIPNNPDYLWLPFCMFKKETFLKYHPFINSGAPFEETMKDINGKLKLIHIPNLVQRVGHEGRATRKIVIDWEFAGNWEKSIKNKDIK